MHFLILQPVECHMFASLEDMRAVMFEDLFEMVEP